MKLAATSRPLGVDPLAAEARLPDPLTDETQAPREIPLPVEEDAAVGTPRRGASQEEVTVAPAAQNFQVRSR